MEVIFLPFAYKELEDAIVYYNDQLVGLGNQFYDEVIVSIKFIQTFSQAWHKVEKHTRRFNLKRFPYLILYVAEIERIIITAVAHQHRHPNYYLRR